MKIFLQKIQFQSRQIVQHRNAITYFVCSILFNLAIATHFKYIDFDFI
jgi:hypothetical protein